MSMSNTTKRAHANGTLDLPRPVEQLVPIAGSALISLPADTDLLTA